MSNVNSGNNVLDKSKLNKDQKVMIDNRKKITLTAVTQAISANDSLVALKVNNTKVNILGKDLQINKVDIEQGVAEIEGTINSIKYLNSNPQDKEGILKRIFK